MKKAILKTSGMLLVVGLAFTAMLFGCKHKTAQKTEAEQQTESVNPAIFTTDGNGKITGYTCSSEELPKNLVIPAKIGDEVITSIGSWAFDGCSDLTSVSLSGCTSLTSIGDSAFYGCSGLTSVNFPASLTSIGSNAFGRCSGLTSVTVDNGNSTYKAVDNVVYTKGGTTLVFAAGGLTSVTIPSTVTSIGRYAFSGCSGLTSVTVDNGNSKYKSVDNVVYTKDGTTLVFAAGGLTSVTIPNTVTSIGRYAFSWCTGLTSVSFPASLTWIGRGAFYNCSGLTSVSFPASLTSIGKEAFNGCNNLTSATFADAAGWAVYSDAKYKNKDSNIQQSDLESAATAAKYLRNGHDKGGYCYKCWKKN